MSSETSLGKLYETAKNEFRLSGIENPGLEALVIICSATGAEPQHIHIKPATQIKQRDLVKCAKMIKRRLAGEPAAYATGYREFFSRSFTVNPSVLIPRPETETVVERALEIMPDGKRVSVIDIGTGSGCIAVTLKKERPAAAVTGADISAEALRTARENSVLHDADISLVRSDMLACFADKSADIVVANPPYVSEREYARLPRSIRDFEPEIALRSDADGLGHLRRIAFESPRVLRRGGHCIVEVGDGQAERCEDMFERSGFDDISIAADIAGRNRAVTGLWKR